MLIDMNAAILRDQHPVDIGRQRVVLPQPDEVPALMTAYTHEVNSRVRALLLSKPERENLVMEVVALACDAHTMFVHIHPFPDGIGLQSRIISGLVLQSFGLPMPLIEQEKREEYIKAVGAAVTGRQYDGLCLMFAEGVLDSLRFIDALLQPS